MSPLSAAAIYFVLWWITLFAVLPFGVKSQVETGEGAEGTDPGAPVLARIGRKFLWTTLVSSIVFALGVWGYRQGLFNVERLTRMFGFPF